MKRKPIMTTNLAAALGLYLLIAAFACTRAPSNQNNAGVNLNDATG